MDEAVQRLQLAYERLDGVPTKDLSLEAHSAIAYAQGDLRIALKEMAAAGVAGARKAYEATFANGE